MEQKKQSKTLPSGDMEHLLTLFDNKNAFRLATELYSEPNQTTAEISETLEVSKSTAFRYLNQLEDVGMVECKWEISRSSPPKAVKSFKLTKRGREVIDLLLNAFAGVSD